MSERIRTAVITGTDAAELGAELQGRVQTVTAIPTVAELVEAVPKMEPGSVDLYVQLPVTVQTEGANAIEVVRNFLSAGLIRRFDAVSAILPALAPTATVALVTGNHPGQSTAPDNPEARLSLMKVLGHTLLLERGAASDSGGRVDVKIITNPPVAAKLAEMVVEPQEKPVRVVGELAAEEPTLDYSEWRDAIMALEEMRA